MVDKQAKYDELEKYASEKTANDPKFFENASAIIADETKDLDEIFVDLESKLDSLVEPGITKEELKLHLYEFVKAKVTELEGGFKNSADAINNETNLKEATTKYDELLDQVGKILTHDAVTGFSASNLQQALDIHKANPGEYDNAAKIPLIENLQTLKNKLKDLKESDLGAFAKEVADAITELKDKANKQSEDTSSWFDNFSNELKKFVKNRDQKSSYDKFVAILKKAKEKVVKKEITIKNKIEENRKKAEEAKKKAEEALSNAILTSAQAKFDKRLNGGDGMLRVIAEELIYEAIKEEQATLGLTLDSDKQEKLIAKFLDVNDANIISEIDKDTSADSFAKALNKRQKLTINTFDQTEDNIVNMRKASFLVSAREKNGGQVIDEFKDKKLDDPAIKAELKKKYMDFMLGDRKRILEGMFKADTDPIKAKTLEKTQSNNWSQKAKTGAIVALGGAALIGGGLYLGAAATGGYLALGAASFVGSRVVKYGLNKIDQLSESELLRGTGGRTKEEQILGSLDTKGVIRGGMNRTATLEGLTRTLARGLRDGKTIKMEDASKIELAGTSDDIAYSNIGTYCKREKQLLDKAVATIIQEETAKGGTNREVLHRINARIYAKGGPEDQFYTALGKAIADRRLKEVVKSTAAVLSGAAIFGGLSHTFFGGTAEALAKPVVDSVSGAAAPVVSPDQGML